MRRDYFLTFACEFAVMASLLAAFKLVAWLSSPEEFALYSLTRRLVSLLQLPLMIGMGISIPRYMAMRAGSGAGDEGGYFLSGASIVLGIVIVAAAGVAVFGGDVGYLFYGDARYSDMATPLMLTVVGTVWHALNYGYFRGKLKMATANVLQVLLMAVIPLAAIGIGAGSAKRVFMVTGLLMVAASAIVSGVVLALEGLGNASWSRTRQLMRYGVVRVPGEFALVGLLALPPVIMAHIRGTTEAGYFAFGISFVTMIGSLFSPIGLVLLPAISKAAAGGGPSTWQGGFVRFAQLSVVVVTTVAFALYLTSGWVISIYLGDGYVSVLPYVRTCLIAAVPYVFYVVSRNVLDALHEKPLNTINLLVALAIFLLLSVLLPGEFLAFGFVAAMFVLGALMYLDIRRSLRSIPILNDRAPFEAQGVEA